MKKRKLTCKKIIGICGVLLLIFMPLKVSAQEITTYATYYEDGSTSPVIRRNENGSQKLYANGNSLIFRNFKMYLDVAPFGEFNSDDRRIYLYEDKRDEEYDWGLQYVNTGGVDDTIYNGSTYLTFVDTRINGIYVNHITNANVYIDNSSISNQCIENADGDVNYTLKNTDTFFGIELLDSKGAMSGKDGGVIKGDLDITLDNVKGGNGQILASGTVLGDTTITINNSSIYSISPAHIVGSESKNAKVSVNVTDSELESISVASWGHFGSPATINGDIDVFVKNSNIELGIYQYGTNTQGSVTNTVNGNATVHVEDSVLRDIIDRGGYANEESISENATVTLKNVEVQDLVTNTANIEGTVKYDGIVVNDLNFVNNAVLISKEEGNGGAVNIYNQISGTGTFKANIAEYGQYIYFEGENPVAKNTKIKIEPVRVVDGECIPFQKNEVLGNYIELRFNKNAKAISYLDNFTCANYELNECFGEDVFWGNYSEIKVLDYCATHNYKLAKSSGNGSLIYQAKLYDKEPDCTHEGMLTYYCKNCGKIKYEKVAAFGHDCEKSKVVKPTLTSKGYTLFKCTRCDYSYKGDYVDALKSIKGATVTLSTSSYTYSGAAKNPTPTVKLGTKTLKKDVDYRVIYRNNVNAGTATVVIMGKGSYLDSVSKTFKINAKSLEKATVTLSTSSYTYNGKAKKPEVTVKIGKVTLKKDTDYTVSYKNNKNVGKATVTVKGKGNYTGTLSKTYTISAKKGTTFSYGANNYKFTSSSAVAFTGVKSAKTTKVEVPKTVKYGGATFKVTAIADKALKSKTKVTKVTIGSNVKVIGDEAFSGCSKLTSVTLGSAVTTIEDKAFYKCTALKKITIPSKVTKIDKQAFSGCKNLKEITIKATKLKMVGSQALKGIHSKAKIYVPKSKAKAYKALLKGMGQASTVKVVAK